MMRRLKRAAAHTTLLGLLVAALFLLSLGPPVAESDRTRVVTTDADVAHVRAKWIRTWNRPPTAEELRDALQRYLREEILYREVLAALRESRPQPHELPAFGDSIMLDQSFIEATDQDLARTFGGPFVDAVSALGWGTYQASAIAMVGTVAPSVPLVSLAICAVLSFWCRQQGATQTQRIVLSLLGGFAFTGAAVTALGLALLYRLSEYWEWLAGPVAAERRPWD